MIAAHPYRRRFLEDPGHLPEARQEMLDRAIGDEFFGSCDGIEGHPAIQRAAASLHLGLAEDLAPVG